MLHSSTQCLYNFSAHAGPRSPETEVTRSSPEMTAVLFISLSVQTAVLSKGGSCDEGSVAPSICPAGGQTAVVPLLQLRPGPHTS